MRIPKQYSHIINDKSIDVDSDGSLCVWLNLGYAFEPHENPNVACHVRVFDTAQEVIEAMKYVEKCPCTDCEGKA
jgi:hypothetical protein